MSAISAYYTCTLVIRLNNCQPEFYLVQDESQSKWNFPTLETPIEISQLKLLKSILTRVGINEDIPDSEYLDEITMTQDGKLVNLCVYLVKIENFPKKSSDSNLKYRWCLAEEARRRIRRKPMRRLIDLALRKIDNSCQ